MRRPTGTERRGPANRTRLPADRHHLAAGRLPLSDLWWRYAGLGGQHSQAAVAGYLNGAVVWADAEHNVLAQTLNEILWDAGLPSLAPRANGCPPLAAPLSGHGLQPPDRRR
jgi:hypothetical protein